MEPGCTWFKLMEEVRKRKLTYLSSEMGGPAMMVGGSITRVSWRMFEYMGLKFGWVNLAEYLSCLGRQGISVNVATYASF